MRRSSLHHMAGTVKRCESRDEKAELLGFILKSMSEGAVRPLQPVDSPATNSRAHVRLLNANYGSLACIEADGPPR